jgi:regulator of RNase E activity RraA
MNPSTRQQLMAVSTATLCTTLFKRGLKNQFIQDVRPLNPGLPNRVGPAFTLRYIPAREDLNTLAAFQDRQHPQRQALDINLPIGCGDVAVWPGDVVVGDGEGVVVIPGAIADEVAAEAVEMTVFEDFVTERVLAGQSILGLYPPTDEQSRVDFAAWRLALGR